MMIICEGQLDCIAIQGQGYDAVAISGTSFSEYQARELFKYDNEFALALDKDEAGQKAIHRIWEVLTDYCIKFNRYQHSKDLDTRNYFLAVNLHREGKRSQLIKDIIERYEVVDDMLNEK